MKNSAFLDSAYAVFLSSQSSIEHEAPACIAAPLVNMILKNSVSLGASSQDSRDKAMLYVPEQLSITTKHLMVGNLLLLVEPKIGFISCKKLTLIKLPGKDPDYFDLIKSWLIYDDVKIETVVIYPKNPEITVEKADRQVKLHF